MGSTSAVISHLQLNNCCFKCLGSIQSRNTSLQVSRRKARLGVSQNPTGRNLRQVVCFAVDEEKDKQQQLGGVGSAVEDRPGKSSIIFQFLLKEKENV